MKHFPATHAPAHLAGLEHTHAPLRVSMKTLLLAFATAFAAGVCATAWFVALVILRTP